MVLGGKARTSRVHVHVREKGATGAPASHRALGLVTSLVLKATVAAFTVRKGLRTLHFYQIKLSLHVLLSLLDAPRTSPVQYYHRDLYIQTKYTCRDRGGEGAWRLPARPSFSA